MHHLFSNLRIWAVLSLLALLPACAKSPSEELLRQTIDAMQTAGEAREVSGLMDHVADDFAGQSASMNRDQLRAFLIGVRMRTQNIGVTRNKTKITLSGDQARAELGFLVTDGGQYLPTTGQYVTAKTAWRFESGRWLLTNSDWQEGLSE